MTSIDKIDRQILKILARYGRKPLKQLASAVGLSRSTLTTRLRRLEREGFIQGYCAILSSSISPRPNQAVLLGKLDKTPAYDIVDAIRQIDEVIQCRSVAGDIDLVLDVAADAVEALNKVRDRVSIISGVADVRTHMVLATNFRTVLS
jgi:Lrp/AsnC family transcriptional regulator, leucine-responsive regulatory protein